MQETFSSEVLESSLSVLKSATAMTERIRGSFSAPPQSEIEDRLRVQGNGASRFLLSLSHGLQRLARRRLGNFAAPR